LAHIVVGFAAGFLSLYALFALSVLCGGREPVFPHTSREYRELLAGAFRTTAVAVPVVSVLEEILFRGALFGILRKAWDWRAAALMSAMVYALAHFLQKADLPGPVTWSSGLALLPAMFAPLADVQTAAPMFFNLTLVGCILALAYQRTGRLFFSIGLHAGWVFWLKLTLFPDALKPGARPWLWGGENMLNGWVTLPILAVVLLLVARMQPTHSDV
jgi:membrane protease YdiL (CAAX protease family)